MLCFFLPTCFLILRLKLSSTQQIILFKIIPEPAQAYGAQRKFNLEHCIVAKFHTVAGRRRDSVEHQHSVEEIYYVGDRQDFAEDDFWLKHILSLSLSQWVVVFHSVPICLCYGPLVNTVSIFFLYIPHIPPAFWMSRTEHGVLSEWQSCAKHPSVRKAARAVCFNALHSQLFNLCWMYKLCQMYKFNSIVMPCSLSSA